MDLAFDSCFRAIQSRDARFDGLFYTGVITTGIYCRPICPATTPRPNHVRFFRSAASAQAAGFRACRRCRPEFAPDHPLGDVHGHLVARALALISQGVVDSEGVGGLAARLSVSARHLHRELADAVGAGPLLLAQARRTQMARTLIEHSDLPMSEIAFTAGFSSIRRFNEAMAATFGLPPGAMRRARPDARPGSGAISLRLAYRPPFDHRSLLDWFALHAVPGLEEVQGDTFTRTVRLGRKAGVLSLRPEGGHVRLCIDAPDLHDLGTLVHRCRALYDLDADPASITRVLSADPVLAPLVRCRPGLRVPGTLDGWEMAARAVLAQGVSVATARSLTARLVRALGEPLPLPRGSLTHVFPTPEAVAGGSLRHLGLTERRVVTLHALAAAVLSGLSLAPGADRERLCQSLLRLPGIGPWTASSISLRALGDPDVWFLPHFPIRHAMRAHPGADPNRWQPWSSYAAMYLWSSTHQRSISCPTK